MLSIAFKEWAVVCRSLAEGRQALILRKGGISEVGGEFRPDHGRFWLYPTFFHAHRTGVKPGVVPLLDAAEADRPPGGLVRLSHFADVAAVHHVTDPAKLANLAPLHGWTDDTVRQRFEYRHPGLYVLVVRVHAAPLAVDEVERPEYAGCKTWVAFDHGLPTLGATPVLDDAAFLNTTHRVRLALE